MSKPTLGVRYSTPKDAAGTAIATGIALLAAAIIAASSALKSRKNKAAS